MLVSPQGIEPRPLPCHGWIIIAERILVRITSFSVLPLHQSEIVSEGLSFSPHMLVAGKRPKKLAPSHIPQYMDITPVSYHGTGYWLVGVLGFEPRPDGLRVRYAAGNTSPPYWWPNRIELFTTRILLYIFYHRAIETGIPDGNRTRLNWLKASGPHQKSTGI